MDHLCQNLAQQNSVNKTQTGLRDQPNMAQSNKSDCAVEKKRYLST